MSKRGKIDVLTETIFAHAVALESSGRMKNTIYGIGRKVYVLNTDHTVLLRFDLPSKAAPFAQPISFKADDYDSPEFYEEDGKIVFVQESGDMTRVKTCGKASMTPEEVVDLHEDYAGAVGVNRVTIHKDVLGLLNDRLSHIEISGKDGTPSIIQRDIFSGNVIEISRKKAEGFGVTKRDDIQDDFGPVGLRTGDFAAMFAFNDELNFYFPSRGAAYVIVTGKNFGMRGVIALCIYDEMGGIAYANTGDFPIVKVSGKEVEEAAKELWVYHPGSECFAKVPAEGVGSDDFDVLGPVVEGGNAELEKLIQEYYDGKSGREKQEKGRGQQEPNRQTKSRQRGRK